MTRAATIDHAKILVVEDSLAEVVLIKHFFATEKITNDVSFATSLREARQALRHHHYDVCFVDIHLPDGQGFELIAELSAMGCLIVMVSDSDDMLNIMKAQGLGAVAFISKPLTKATLDRLVKEMRQVHWSLVLRQ